MADAVITLKSIYGREYSWTWEQRTGTATNTATGETKFIDTRNEFIRFVFDQAKRFGHTIILIAA